MEKSYIINEEEYNDFKDAYEKISKMPDEMQRMIYYSCGLSENFNMPSSIHVYGIKDSDDKTTVYDQKRDVFCGKKIFYKSTSISCFTFYKKTKKIKFFGTNIKSSLYLINIYFKFCKYDWFTNMHSCYRDLITKTVLEQIIQGKITNEEAYLKKVNKVSFKGVFYYSSIKKMVKWYMTAYPVHYYGIISLLRQISKTVDNPNAFIDRIVKGEINKDYIRTFKDTYSQCLIFDKKVCWKWSLKRLNDFHLKLTEQETEMRGELRGNNKVTYNGTLPLPQEAKCSLISDEKSAFIEGQEQSNCVYTSYWRRIREKSYFILRCTYPERASVGISVVKKNEKSKKFDLAYLSQIYGKYNKTVKPETAEIFKKWLTNENVQKFFIDNYFLNKPSIEESNNNQFENDLDYGDYEEIFADAHYV